jgi:signal transduction histidine kinase
MMTGLADTPLPGLGRGNTATDRRGYVRPRVRTRESLRFLTEVGNALAASLDYEITLQKVAELTVPRLACYCELDLVEEGRVRRVGLAHGDPERREALSRRLLFPAQARDTGPLAEVLGSGEPLLLTSKSARHPGMTARDRERLDLLRLAGATSLLLIPLIARGRALGVLLLASTRTDRVYGLQDRILADELGRIAALAIDNARLYSEANQAIRARDDMLRVVSHDLRNPIGAMASAASLVLEDTASELRDGPSRRMLRTIVHASKQASRMIDDLLDLSRIETGRLTVDPRPEALAPLIMEAVELHGPVARQRGIDLGWVSYGPPPVVMADRERLLQLMGNLLGNAIKFTPPAGRIEIAAAVCGEEVRCSVADTGPGIPPDQLPHVFDRFWQAARADRAGLGLGLAIVQGIAEAHGGRVWVESEPGIGTTFVFTLPLAASPAPGREASQSADPG